MSFGRTVILGDSYSTFEGAIPEGNDCWFFEEPKNPTNVCKIEQTWWYPIFDGKKNILLKNESYSGATVCNSVRPCHPISASFINRFDKMVEEGFFKDNQIDTFIIFGGTNDSWTDCPLGELKFDDFTEEELLCALPAFGYLGRQVSKVLPATTKVYWLINTELKSEIVDGLIKTAEHFGHNYIRFTDIDKMYAHPSIKGMRQIYDVVTERI